MKKLTIALASAASLALVACGSPAEETDATTADETAMTDDAMAGGMDTMETGTIVDVASGNEDFSTLVAAVQAAGLVETLSGEGPFTVFAPNNAAFAALPDGTVEDLTTNNTDLLGTILQYHVVSGAVDSATLVQAITDAGDAGYTVETVGGGTLTATLDGENVVLTDATGATSTVVATDVAASNGTIHVIDTVLMPQ